MNPETTTQNKPRRRLFNFTRIYWIGGFLMLVSAVLFWKLNANSSQTAPESSNEAQLNQVLEAGHPTLVFLHSLECIPCRKMINVIGNVYYNEFSETITLIDVNIYEDENASLLRRERLQRIPTLVFYDRSGNRQVHIGVMESEQLRQTLQALIDEH